MNIPFLDLKAQFKQIEDEVIPVVTEAMRNGAFIGGPQVSGFEEEFAKYCDSKYCVGVGSGTDALRFALIAAGVASGDEVITVPNTFIATTEAISQVGATPVFVDIMEDTCNIDPNKIKSAISPKTKAIIPVHLYGQPADMDAILRIAAEYKLLVVEDACQAHGATYKGKRAGGIGLAGCFSFYPGKNLGAFGEAGAVVTQDESLANKIKMIRDHGQAKKYFHSAEGFNGRLDAIQAGILRVKLRHLPDWTEARRNAARKYTEYLENIPEIRLPYEPDTIESVYHLYVVHTHKRDALQSYLQENGIATGLHYPLPLHLQDAYRFLNYKKGDFPVAEKSASKLLSLPMFPEITEEQIQFIVSKIKKYFSGA